jgi:SPP1 gp7 family putative phage head morphogenesis protein
MGMIANIRQGIGRASMAIARSVGGMGVLANADMAFWRYGTRMGMAPYLDRVRERPYQYHAWVYACARWASTNVARLPQKMVTPENQTSFIKSHEILDLLANPNPYMTSTTFRQSICLSLLLSSAPNRDSTWTNTQGGQCFIICWNDKTGKPANVAKGEMPTQLYPFSDSYFRPLPGPKGAGGYSLRGWRYHIPSEPGSQPIDFENGEIIRIYQYNPYDMLSGMAPYMAAQVSVDTDAKADVYNTKLFDNDGRPTGLLSTEQQNVPPEIQKQLLKNWNEAYGGIGNVGKTALLANGLKYQQLGLANSDMQWLEQRGFNKEQIMAVFGANLISLSQIDKLNFNIVKEGKKIGWYDTLMPLDELIRDAFNTHFVVPRTNGKYLVISDYSGIESLREDFKTRAETGGILVKDMAFPPTLAARITKIPITEADVQEFPWLNERVIPITARVGSNETIAQATDGETEAPAEPKEPAKAVHKSIAGDVGSEARKAFSKAYGEHLDKSAMDFAETMRRFFYRQRNEMQGKVDEWLKKNGKSVKAEGDGGSDGDFDPIDPQQITPEMFLLDEVEETKKLLEAYKPYIKVQSEKEVAEIEKELNETIEWSVTDPQLAKWAAQRKEDLAGINTTTFNAARDEIGDAVKQGIADGLTPVEMAKKLKQTIYDVAQIRVNNAGTIARTEMGIISSNTRYEAFQAEGIEKWEWVTAHDEFVRETHAAIDGTVVKVGELFPIVNGMYPRDEDMELENICNCRCVAVAARD